MLVVAALVGDQRRMGESDAKLYFCQNELQGGIVRLHKPNIPGYHWLTVRNTCGDNGAGR